MPGFIAAFVDTHLLRRVSSVERPDLTEMQKQRRSALAKA
jgi:hypothetical protein